MDSNAVKQAVMKQVLAEANMANARVLIEVGACYICGYKDARIAD